MRNYLIGLLVTAAIIGVAVIGYNKGFTDASDNVIQNGDMHWGRQAQICWWSGPSDDGVLLGVQCRD